MPAEHVAMMISHRVTRIGIFHRGLKRFVLWHGMILNGAKPVGLPQAEIGPHGIQMKELADGRLSKQYEFNVPDPGIYLLHTEWSLTTRDMNGKKPFVRKGNPVLFFVEPAADYELQATKRAGEFEGLNLQSYQEKLYDNSPSESGFVMPKFEESEF